MTPLILNQSNLIKFLKDIHLDPQIEDQSGLTYVNIQANDRDLPLFFVIRGKDEILQLVCYLPFQLGPDQKSSVARLLHLLNRDIDLPGFGMDEEQGLLFYRLVIPCIGGKIHDDLLRVYIDTVKIVCDSFSHAIGLVNSGSIGLEELKQQALHSKKPEQE